MSTVNGMTMSVVSSANYQAGHDERGSLVYYLSSWICGGFFLTVAMFLQESASSNRNGNRS